VLLGTHAFLLGNGQTYAHSVYCSILSRFSHFHVAQFPPLQVGAANSCLAFSSSPRGRPRTAWMDNINFEALFHTLSFHTNFSRIFHPCKLVPHFHVSQFLPVQTGAANSCLAFSGPAFLTVPYFHVSHFQSPLPRVPAPGIVTCIIAFSRQLPRFLMV